MNSSNTQRVELARKIGSVILGIGVAFLIAALSITFFTSAGREILTGLRDPAYARGVITFIVALGTIVIAITLLVAVLAGIGDADAEKRFNSGREVLTVLIGVLGTIIGFYFGTTSDGELGVTVSAPILEVEDAAGHLTAFVTGGRDPYRYEISFEPATIPAITDKISEDGWIRETFDVPTGDTISAYRLEVTDASDVRTVVEGSGAGSGESPPETGD